MAEFLTTTKTSSAIEDIIIDANKNIYLISPYLQLSRNVIERLKEASLKGVKIHMVYRENKLKENDLNSLADFKNLHLYILNNLHAKCYFNEKKLVITSMNLYEFSEKNNREMGVLIEKDKDKELYEKAVNESESIINISLKAQIKNGSIKAFSNSNDPSYQTSEKPQYNYNKLKKSSPEIYQRSKAKSEKGVCIRCKDEIGFDPSKPLCPDCYSSWSKWSDVDYNENFCHRCGKDNDFFTYSVSRPQCGDCYIEWNKNQPRM
jgi:hypothetical protein